MKTKYLYALFGLVVKRDRRGAALIIALIILLLFTLIGSTIMMISVNDDRMINDRMNHISALAAAEAGIAESIRRLSLPPSDTLMLGDPAFPPQAGWKTYILFDEEPPPPESSVYYVKSIQMILPESLHIPYSTKRVEAARTLMICHKRDAKSEDKIVYYNWNEEIEEAHIPGSYQGKYFPVEIIESTGSSGNSTRTLQVEVAKGAFVPTVAGALSCNTDVEISGKLTCCGHDHSFTTPWGTNAGSDRLECFDDPERDDAIWHESRADARSHALPALFEKDSSDRMCTETGCLPGISAPGHEIQMGNGSIIRGNPDYVTDPARTEFYYLYEMLNSGSWEELEEQFPWQALEPGKLEGGTFIGYYRCEGDLELRGVVSITGVLWVTGTLKQRGHLSARGIIYARRSLACNGNVWILGAVAIEGEEQKLMRPFDGKGVLLYSRDGIERALAAAGGYHIIARREK